MSKALRILTPEQRPFTASHEGNAQPKRFITNILRVGHDNSLTCINVPKIFIPRLERSTGRNHAADFG
jgi:hypothetical protein